MTDPIDVAALERRLETLLRAAAARASPIFMVSIVNDIAFAVNETITALRQQQEQLESYGRVAKAAGVVLAKAAQEIDVHKGAEVRLRAALQDIARVSCGCPPPGVMKHPGLCASCKARKALENKE